MNSNEREQLMEIRRWSRIQREMEETAARNHISPGESKNEKRLREDIDFLLSLIDGQPDAATRMRDACVERVRASGVYWREVSKQFQRGDEEFAFFTAKAKAADDIERDLQSLTLDQVEEKQ